MYLLFLYHKYIHFSLFNKIDFTLKTMTLIMYIG